MRLAVFGATGGTGRLLVDQALEAGHHVVALARDPSRLAARHPHLSIVPGDVTDPAAVERVVSGAEAVLSALGSRVKTRGNPLTQGTKNILAAMERHGVRRLVLTSTPSAADPKDEPGFRLKLAVGLIRLLAPSVYQDIVQAARVVRASDREWTLVRVSLLTDGPKTGRLTAGPATRTMGMRITRADLARFLLEQVNDPRWVRQAPAVSS